MDAIYLKHQAMYENEEAQKKAIQHKNNNMRREQKKKEEKNPHNTVFIIYMCGAQCACVHF